MSNWTNQEQLAGAPSILYNDATVTYDQVNYNYNGQVKVVWTNQTEN